MATYIKVISLTSRHVQIDDQVLSISTPKSVDVEDAQVRTDLRKASGLWAVWSDTTDSNPVAYTATAASGALASGAATTAASGLQSDIAASAGLVAATLVNDHNTLVTQVNQLITDHNTLQTAHNTLVAEHNALQNDAEALTAALGSGGVLDLS